jgi:putative membrane protein
MRNLNYLVAGIVVLFLMQACKDRHAKNYNNAAPDQDAVSFIKNGIEGGLTEIKASGLVITNSNNQRVIALAKMMIDDHTKAGEELKRIESDKKVNGDDSIFAVHQFKIDSLSKKSGNAFDKAYLQMMITDHTGAIKLFINASHNPDAEISKFASETLPTIQMHLDSANAVLLSFK